MNVGTQLFRVPAHTHTHARPQERTAQLQLALGETGGFSFRGQMAVRNTHSPEKTPF